MAWESIDVGCVREEEEVRERARQQRRRTNNDANTDELPSTMRERETTLSSLRLPSTLEFSLVLP